MLPLLWFWISGEHHSTKPWLWTKAEFDLNFGFRPNSYSFSLGPTLVTQFSASLFFSAIINQEFFVTKLNAFWFPTQLPQFSLNTPHFLLAEPKLSFTLVLEPIINTVQCWFLITEIWKFEQRGTMKDLLSSCSSKPLRGPQPLNMDSRKLLILSKIIQGLFIIYIRDHFWWNRY